MKVPSPFWHITWRLKSHLRKAKSALVDSRVIDCVSNSFDEGGHSAAGHPAEDFSPTAPGPRDSASPILRSLIVAVILTLAAPSNAQRLKDVAGVQGVRGNQLVGFGLVVGLEGTGDG